MFKKNILLISLMSLISLADSLNASVFIDVKINTLECISCYAGNLAIDKFENGTAIRFVFPKISKQTIERFISRSYLSEIVLKRNIQIISSDSVYQELDINRYSEVFIYNDDILVYHFAFKDFWRNTNDFSSFLHTSSSDIANVVNYKIIEKIELKSEIDFQYPIITVSDHYIVLMDRVLNLCSVFDKMGSLVSFLDGMQLEAEEILPNLYDGLDTVIIKDKVKQLKSIGYFSVLIESCFIVEDRLFMSLSVPYIKKQAVDDRYTIFRKLIVSQYSLTDCKIINYLIPNEDSESINLSTNMLNIIGDTVFIPQITTDEKTADVKYFITRYQKQGDSLKFEGKKKIVNSIEMFKSSDYKSVNLKCGLVYIQNSSKIESLNGDYFVEISNLVGDFSPNLNNYSNFILLDWFFDFSTGISCVFYNKETDKYFISNKRNQDTECSIQEIDISTKDIFSFYFLNNDQLFVVMKNNVVEKFQR